MIKRLRKKFIIVTMCSVLAVLVLIVGIINIVSYVNVIKNVDYVISLIKDGGGRFKKTKATNNRTMKIPICRFDRFRRKCRLERDFSLSL